MRCRRICRELLWLARFGEFGPSSAPHLDHLAECGHCRDEVGFDRALVQQLRIALAARIAEDEPSPRAWEAILARAQAPDRGIWASIQGHVNSLALKLRTATAVTAMALAGIIASSTHIAITHPEAGSAETEVMPSAAGELYERQALVPRPPPGVASRVPVTYVVTSVPTDPEAAFMVTASLASPGALAASSLVGSDESGSETGILTDITLGQHASRQSPVDPVGGGLDASTGRSADVGATTAAGEPF